MSKKERAESFLAELEKLMRYCDISISHQDFHGSFILTDFNERDLQWIRDADLDLVDK